MEASCTPTSVCTSGSLHDNAQQEPAAAPPRVPERLNQSLQAALRAFESVPLARRRGPVGGWAPWRGEPRALQGGAGASAGTSRRAAGGPVGGEAGGGDGVKRGFFFPISDDKPFWVC